MDAHEGSSGEDNDVFEPTSEAWNWNEEDEGDSNYEEEEEEEEDEEIDEDDDDNDEFHDADDGDVELEVVIEGAGHGLGTDGDGDNLDAGEHILRRQILRLIGGVGRPNVLTSRQLLALLRGRDLGHVLFHELDEDEDEYEEWRRHRRTPLDPNRFPKVPSQKGTELMNSGIFGATDPQMHMRKRLNRMIYDRELGLGDRFRRKTEQELMAQAMIPSSDPEMIIHYDEPVYSGQFSDDGNFFFACVKDFKVRMYDTSNPYSWRHYKTVSYPFGQWTLTDASLSPDNRWLAYTSISSNVCLAPTDPNDKGDPYTLDLADQGGAPARGWRSRRSFGIFSIRYSGDGRELVAGTNTNSIVVYDIESRRVLHHIHGHDDEVNAVCFADKSSPHILYSGSDDATLKVWDRRSMGDGREAGAFIGHTEGLTYIDSKGDGRYVLSNGKDQTMKLWDLRMVMSTDRYRELNPNPPRLMDFDYRWSDFDEDEWVPHPHDNSLVTFRGHKVLRTLIRCHFSPPGSTNSRYVYSASADGKVYIWNMDATLAGTIDVRRSTEKPWPTRRYHHAGFGTRPGFQMSVRDASWHPNAPVLVASAINGSLNYGTCTLHSYNESHQDDAEPEMGLRVNEKLLPKVEERMSGTMRFRNIRGE